MDSLAGAAERCPALCHFLIQIAIRSKGFFRVNRNTSIYNWKGEMMKLVTAVIRPSRLDQVRDALLAAGIVGLTVVEVKGYGRQKGHTEVYRGAEYDIQFIPKLKIEIVLPKERLQEIIDIVVMSARTGKVGDGKIFVTDVEHVVRIRTGETNIDAL